jgi:hypothetical protein
MWKQAGSEQIEKIEETNQKWIEGGKSKGAKPGNLFKSLQIKIFLARP